MLGLASSLASASIHEQRYSVSLDGTNDYISTPIGWQPSVSSGYENVGSFSVWVKKIAAESDAYIFGTSTGTSSNNEITLFYDISEETLQFLYRGDSTSNAEVTYAISDEAFSAVGWAHIVVTWDDTSSGTCKLWFNGTEIDESSTRLTPFATLPDRFHIGKRSSVTSGYWKGNISEAALFSRVLSGAEIATIYSNKNPFDLSITHSLKLEAYWKMDEGTATTAKDTIGTHSCDGTLQNGALWSVDTPDD